MIELEEFAPNRWRVKREGYDLQKNKSGLPIPFVISDAMPATEQVDGKLYTSKSEFRKVGRAAGLTEVGTEKLTPRVVRASSTAASKQARRDAIKKAVAKFRG